MIQWIKDYFRLRKVNKQMAKLYTSSIEFFSIEHLEEYEREQDQYGHWFKVETEWHGELWDCHMWPEFNEVGPQWCDDNGISRYKFGLRQPAGLIDATVYFESEADAVAFKLWWL